MSVKVNVVHFTKFETRIERDAIFKGVTVIVLRLVGVVTYLYRWYFIVTQYKIFDS